MDVSHLTLSRIVQLIPMLGAFLLGYNTYLQILVDNDPLLSAFSLAVFLIFLVSIASIAYGHSLPRQGSEKEKATATLVVVCLFSSIGAAFLIRVWTVLPSERSWVVPASCTIPISGLMAFIFFRRMLAST